MPLCVPHYTGGGACRPGANSKLLSTAAWFINVKDATAGDGVLQVQRHKCESGIGTTVRIMTLGIGGKRSDMQSRRFKQGDVNVDPYRIILTRAPFTCVATADNLEEILADLATLDQHFWLDQATSPLFHQIRSDDGESYFRPAYDSWDGLQRLIVWSVRNHLIARLKVEERFTVLDQWQVIDALVQQHGLRSMKELGALESVLREKARQLFDLKKSLAYPHHTNDNLCLAYLVHHQQHMTRNMTALIPALDDKSISQNTLASPFSSVV